MPTTLIKLVAAVEARVGGDSVIQTDKEALLVLEVVKATLAEVDLHVDKRTGEIYSPAPTPARPTQGPAHSRFDRAKRRR